MKNQLGWNLPRYLAVVLVIVGIVTAPLSASGATLAINDGLLLEVAVNLNGLVPGGLDFSVLKST